MRLIKRTEEYVVDSEEDAIKLIQNFKDDAEKNGYRKALIASGQKERAGELGLTDMAFRDPVLDGAFEPSRS